MPRPPTCSPARTPVLVFYKSAMYSIGKCLALGGLLAGALWSR